MKSFSQALISKHIVISSLKVSLVVGTVLNIINQSDGLFSTATIAWGHLMLNYFVPYCVASYSAAKNQVYRNENTNL
ncbi:MAG: hypothetical protein ACI84K_001197 [Pseudohongiellaceae bacterium]|jgi:hypothetical protein